MKWHWRKHAPAPIAEPPMRELTGIEKHECEELLRVQDEFARAQKKALLEAESRLLELELKYSKELTEIDTLRAQLRPNRPNPYFPMQNYQCQQNIGPNWNSLLGSLGGGLAR